MGKPLTCGKNVDGKGNIEVEGQCGLVRSRSYIANLNASKYEAKENSDEPKKYISGSP